MKISNRVHQIKINFSVTPQIKRFVNIYLIEGKNCYLIDTGVSESEIIISEYMKSIGRDIQDIKAIFLTHSHPDHIGAANVLKRMTNCKIYASAGEKDWIENIDKQFDDRPIPNFYGLLNKSVKIDEFVADNDCIELEDGLTIRVVETSGHSKESLSYYLEEDNVLFTGDAIPVVGDIPIYVSAVQSMETLQKIRGLDNIEYYCSAWDEVHNAQSGKETIDKSLSYLKMIDKCVKDTVSKYSDRSKEELFENICEKLEMKPFVVNPLFKGTILSTVYENTKR